MIRKSRAIGNEKVTVAFILPEGAVSIQSSLDVPPRIFCGIPGLFDKFNEFEEFFNSHITYGQAIAFFTPTIGNYVVNK